MATKTVKKVVKIAKKNTNRARKPTKTSNNLQKKIHQTVLKQREFFNSGATRDIKFRIDALKKLERVMDRYEQELYDTLKLDFQKSTFESFITEFAFTKLELGHFIKHLKKWAKPQKIKASILNYPSKDKIISQPYGVTLIIGPWNYPYQLVLAPLIGAIGSGNCAIVKPSELTPATSALLAKIIGNTFAPNHVTVVQGEVETSKALLEERFDFIFFTGSTNVGRIVQQAAAKHLTPTILELGGKSPCIVDKTANLSVAAKRIAWGKLLNGGQTCVAPDYLLVESSINDELLNEIKIVIESFYTRDVQTTSDFPRIINRRNFDRLNKMINKSKVFHGGSSNAKELYIEPTILTGITTKDVVMKEEIFGPILPVITYTNIDEAIKFVNENEKPLALYLFTERSKIKKKVLAETTSGDVSINDTITHLSNPNIPFGGVGESGMGFYHGKASFDAFSHKRGVMDKGTWYDNSLRYPPYTAKKLKLAKALFKLLRIIN